ncbi:MAG TPA: carboxypeptidase-like regulatory domain-containing protein, partial [Chitinophaga sp.]
MKTTVLWMIIPLLQIHASAFSQKVTLHEKSISLKQFFIEVNKQTGYNVVWSSRNTRDISKITVNLDNASLETALDAVLKNTGLHYTLSEKNIIIEAPPAAATPAKNAAPAPPADITVTGSVRDAKGQIMPGVTIMAADNPKLGTVSDENGNFVLTVKDGTVLRISSVGFVTQLFTISTINKTLKVVLLE